MRLYDLILERALDGQRPKLIAQDLSCTITTVYSAIHNARKRGHAIPHYSTGRVPVHGGGEAVQEIRFNLPRDAAILLTAEAKRRNLPPSRLAREMITTICDDTMFTAILDD